VKLVGYIVHVKLNDKMQSPETLIIVESGNCLFVGCLYSLDGTVGVIIMLVFPVCGYD
jgi:hypothetical protein